VSNIKKTKESDTVNSASAGPAKILGGMPTLNSEALNPEKCLVESEILLRSDRLFCLGDQMSCKNCTSETVQKLDGELTLSAADLRGLSISPVYVCQSVVVCLECGFAELIIPLQKLENFSKRTAARASSASS
jgi:hypothetical protein